MLAPEGLLLNRAIQESQEEVMKGIVGNLEPGEGMILMDSVKGE